MSLTHSQLIELVVRGMPYGNQCREFDMSEPGALRFTWRGNLFRVSASCHVEERRDGCLVGSDLAILAQAALHPTYVEMVK